MVLSLKHIRNCSSKIATTLSTAGKMEKATSLVENTHNILEKDTVQLLLSQFPYAVRNSLPRTDPQLHNVIKRFDDMCYHTGPERNLVTSTIFTNAYKGFELPENLTAANLKMASMLGWIFEHLTTAIYFADDIFDGSNMRFKKPCWHTLPNIGLTCMLDARQLSMGAFALLRKYLKDHSSYRHLHSILADFQYITNIGQSADILAPLLFKKTRDPNLLSMQPFLAKVKFKTTRIVYHLPILAAVHLANLDPYIFFKSHHIVEVLGVHRQAQNDMRDCCGEFTNIEKTATDIKGGVSTWITATLLQHGSEEQKKVLVENYGREQDECHQKIYSVLKEFDILKRYRNLTEEVVKKCNDHTSTAAHPGMAKIINLIVEQNVNVDERFYL